MSTKIFVYGTLQSGHGANKLMGNGVFVRKGQIKGTMYDMGGFPAVTDGDSNITGEIWEVDEEAIKRMDQYEGHPNFYRRTDTVTVDGEKVEFYKNISGHKGRPVILSGVWK